MDSILIALEPIKFAFTVTIYAHSQQTISHISRIEFET